MATLNDILGYAEGLADAGTGVSMSKWGMQCAALPNAISTYFFGKTLWGNAIDLLNSARDLGYEVEYNQEGNADSKPRAGAVFVQETTYLFGHSYGHTGLVIEDSDGYTMRTIEQNIDGNEDSLYVGGPARYNTRDFTAIVGWFYFPVDGQPAQVEPITPSGYFLDLLNIVRMELDTSGAVVAIKKELDKSVEANNDAIAKIQALTKDNEEKANQIQKIKEVAEWNVLVRVTDTDNPLDPTLYARGLELVETGQAGKEYKAHDIFVVNNPNHIAKYGEGTRVLVQVNNDFTYNGESIEELEGKLSQDGKLAVWKWELPKESKPAQPSGDLETQPVATATPQPLI